jgi:hypothetical protein
VGWLTKNSSSLIRSSEPPKIPVNNLIRAGDGMVRAQAALAAYLGKAYPNLSTNDIIKLMASGLTVEQIDKYLSHLCGGLSGIAQLIMDGYSGDANAQDLLDQLIQLGDSGKDGDVGAQRIMGLLNIFGMDTVEGVEVPLPNPAKPTAPPLQLRRADIVLKSGIAIEVGGSSKVMKRGDKFVKEIESLVKEYGADKVEIYLEDKGGSAIGRAKTLAMETLASALGGNREKAKGQVITFKPSDRLCVESG